jgi:hypothetical protein
MATQPQGYYDLASRLPEAVMDEPSLVIDPPDIRRCAICGDAGASYGFGPPGNPAPPAEAWYCATHREEGERRWSARYGRPGMLRDPTSLL